MKNIEKLSAIVLAVLALCVLITLASCLDYSVPGQVKIIRSGLTFPGGAWKVVYIQDGRQHIEIFRTKEEAENAGF